MKFSLKTYAVVFSIVSLYFVLPYGKAIRHGITDFTQYHKAGQYLTQGKDIYYQLEKETGVGNVYSPFFITMFLPLSFVNELFAYFIWYWIKVFLWFGIVILSIRICNQENRGRMESWPTIPIIISFIVSFKYIQADMEGQTNNIVLFFSLLSCYFLMRGDKILPSFFLSIATSIKPFSALLWTFFLAKKAIPDFFLFPLFLIFLNVVYPAFIVKGGSIELAKSYISYVIIKHIKGEVPWFEWNNQSLKAFLGRLLSDTYAFDHVKINLISIDPNIIKYISLFILLSSPVIIFLIFRGKSKAFQFEVAATMAIASVVSPVTEKHHMVHTFFGYFVLLNYILSEQSLRLRVKDKKLILFLCFSAFLNLVFNRDIIGKFYFWSDAFGIPLISIFALIFALFRARHLYLKQTIDQKFKTNN